MEENSNPDAANNMETVQEVLNDPQRMSELLNQLTSDPDALSKIAGSARNQIPSGLMNQAKKLAMGSNGKQIQKMIGDKKLNIGELRRMKKGMKQSAPKMRPKTGEAVFISLLIGSNRKAKERKFVKSDASTIFDKFPQHITASHLSIGPWTDREITLYYGQVGGENRRGAKLLGKKVSGDVLIYCSNFPIREADLISVERALPAVINQSPEPKASPISSPLAGVTEGISEQYVIFSPDSTAEDKPEPVVETVSGDGSTQSSPINN
jgi:hypothetical protein